MLRSQPHSLRAARVAALILAGVGLSALAPAPRADASGTTLAQCQAAGRAGVLAGSWDTYHCTFSDGGWHLLPE